MPGPQTMPQPQGIAISDEDFARFQEFFYRKTGISFDAKKRYFVDKRLVDRVEALRLRDFREYFTHLRFQVSGEEVQTLINAMTVNETYFYREEYQFRCLVQSILPELVRRKAAGERLRIWSIPCSTGEEPYSLALYLLEHWEHVDRFDIEIVASDIDTKVLEAARQGRYGERALQYLPQATRRRFFSRVAEDTYQIIDDLRTSIEFTTVNLNDPLQTRRHRDFDVVFCRNLLIYFDDLSRRQAADTIFDALQPGGFCCLGHSESMSRISPLFRVRRFPDAIVYQKPDRGEEP
ncbi:MULTISPECIES: protein-glutamate O-methyltransferase CheR [unclassified Azospirillum]|uniref:CheR family methyltransferase n=1 Tax=unclassified Azospirillum TaxID=2630922 RepID=UPI001FFE44AB|nr:MULTISPECIES: protein-glutamate O-methyltransferase CheR [unclassified Azospirillum]